MSSRARKGTEPDPIEAQRFVEQLAGTLTEGGVPRMPARVFAVLLCTDDGRATAAELADSLQVSPAGISGAVRYLQQVGLVAREREPGGRRDVYRLYNDLWYEAFGNRDAMLSRWVSTFTDGAEVFGPQSRVGVRMQETSRFMAFLRAELPQILERWRASQR